MLKNLKMLPLALWSSWRALNGASAVACLAALAIAYFYMERYLLLEPCPLCILDRIVAAAMAALFAASIFFQKTIWRQIALGGQGVFLLFGFYFTLRHIWLQSRPLDEAADCIIGGAPTEKNLSDIVRESFSAGGDCGAVYWEFLGLSIPEQTFLFFAAMMLLTLRLFQLRRRAE